MSLVWRCLRRYRWYCLTALLFVLLEANCELLLPPLMARMIDEGVRTGELGRVLDGSRVFRLLCERLSRGQKAGQQE